ncbi:MAG: hypothetical protein GY940_23540 [bacterium]|nr:hypothetical protein [bacterium]
MVNDTNDTSDTIRLVPVEFIDELESFRSYCRGERIDTSGYAILSFQPKVRAWCKSNAPELQCIDTLAFFDNTSHELALKKSHQLTTLIVEQLNFGILSPIRHTLVNAFIYYSRFYLNNYLRVLEVMKGIKKKYGTIGVEIYAVSPVSSSAQPPSGQGPHPFLIPRDQFLAPLVRDYCHVHDLSFTEIPAASGEPGSPGSPSSSAPFVPKLLRKLAHRMLRKKLQQRPETPLILLAALSYNLDRLYGDIVKRFPNTACVTAHRSGMTGKGYLKFCLKEMFPRLFGKDAPDPILTVPIDMLEPPSDHSHAVLLRTLKNAYREFRTRNMEVFIYENCSLLPVLDPKVEGDLLPYLVSLDRQARGQAILLEDLKPKLLVSPVSIDGYQAWAELCKREQIPSLVIPQKGLVAPNNRYAAIEERYIGRAQVTGDFQYAAAQTPWVRQYLKWSGYDGEILETGNLIFARLNGKTNHLVSNDFPAGKKIIVYAPSMKSRKSHRFYVLETLDELIDSIRDVIHAVSQLEDAHLVLRIHPGEPITRKEIETLITLPSNVSVSDKGTFEEVLASASLTLSFSSTSIQESLINHVPVLLYDKWKRYNHLEAPAIKDRIPGKISAAYYADAPKQLKPVLKWILDTHSNDDDNEEIFKNCRFPDECLEGFFEFVGKHLEG